MAKFLYWPAGAVVGGGGGGGTTGVFDPGVFDLGVLDDGSVTTAVFDPGVFDLGVLDDGSTQPPPVAGVYEADVYVTDVYDDGSGGNAPVTLGLGAATLLTSGPSAVATSWLAAAGSGFAPATGDALVRLLALDNGSGAWPPTVTIGGTAVTFRVGQDAAHGGTSKGLMVWIGTARALAVGSRLDVALTASGTTGVGKIMLRVSDISGWTGNTGASASALVSAGSTTQVSASVALARTGSLLVGVGGVNDANLGVPPGLAAAGWNEEAEASVGTTGGNSTDAVWVSATGGVAGTLKTLTVAGSAAATDWACALLELT